MCSSYANNSRCIRILPLLNLSRTNERSRVSDPIWLSLYSRLLSYHICGPRWLTPRNCSILLHRRRHNVAITLIACNCKRDRLREDIQSNMKSIPRLNRPAIVDIRSASIETLTSQKTQILSARD